MKARIAHGGGCRALLIAALLAASAAFAGPPRVALTFDDGPRPEFLSRALDILDRYHVKATFFEVGVHVHEHASWSRECARRGHEIGNHSYNHAYLPRCNEARVRKEVVETNEAIRKAAGVTPRWLRPPYGATNAEVRKVAAEAGMGIALWTIDPDDWLRSSTPQRTTSRVLSHLKPNAIILLHEVPATLDALPAILSGITERGYQIVTFGEMKRTASSSKPVAALAQVRPATLVFTAGSATPVRGGRPKGWVAEHSLLLKLRVPRGFEGTLLLDLAGDRGTAQRVIVGKSSLGTFRGTRQVLAPLSARQTRSGLLLVKIMAAAGSRVRVTAVQLEAEDAEDPR